MCRRIIPGPDHLVDWRAIWPMRLFSYSAKGSKYRNRQEIATYTAARSEITDFASAYLALAYKTTASENRFEILTRLALQEISPSIHCSGSGCNLGGICLPIQRWPRGRGKPEEVATALLFWVFAMFDRNALLAGNSGGLFGWQFQRAQN